MKDLYALYLKVLRVPLFCISISRLLYATALLYLRARRLTQSFTFGMYKVLFCPYLVLFEDTLLCLCTSSVMYAGVRSFNILYIITADLYWTL